MSGWPDSNRRPPEPHLATIKGGKPLPPFLDYITIYQLFEMGRSTQKTIGIVLFVAPDRVFYLDVRRKAKVAPVFDSEGNKTSDCYP